MANPHESPDDYRTLGDAELLETYERTTGLLGDTHVDALIAEIKRRVVDV